MSKFGKIIKSVTGILGMNPKIPKMPEAVIPAAPAPVARADAGASINIGSRNADSRVSGGGTTEIGRQVDVLGGLGLSGLRI